MKYVAWSGRFFGAFAGCCIAIGCQNGRIIEPTYEVSGVVTVNGAPLKDGLITFESEVADGQPPGSGIITDGAYTAKSRAGKKKVVITADKATGEKDSGGFPVTVNWLPAEYNNRTKLTAEVTPTGPNKFDFTLKK